MWRRRRLAIISAIKEGARRHPRRSGFALHLCRSDVHVRGVRDACNSLITTRRLISDTHRYDFPGLIDELVPCGATVLEVADFEPARGETLRLTNRALFAEVSNAA
jgi:hypothetical protein